jgi:tripartite motif-containing protein 71
MQGAGASSEDGAWSLSTGPGGRGLAKIAVRDTDNHRVDVFDRNGNGLGQFDQGFDLPTGIAPDAGSNLYVKDGNTHCQADKFDNKGQFLFQFGACANSGIGLGVFDNLGSLAVDASGNVWVTSQCRSRRVQPRDPLLGSALWYRSGLCRQHLCNERRSVYRVQRDEVQQQLSLAGSHRLRRFRRRTVQLSPEYRHRRERQPLRRRHGQQSHREIRYKRSVLEPIRLLRFGNGQFNYPVGLAFDLHGHVYVSDVGNNRIQKFDPNGNYLSQFGSNQLFLAPSGVVVRN